VWSGNGARVQALPTLTMPVPTLALPVLAGGGNGKQHTRQHHNWQQHNRQQHNRQQHDSQSNDSKHRARHQHRLRINPPQPSWDERETRAPWDADRSNARPGSILTSTFICGLRMRGGSSLLTFFFFFFFLFFFLFSPVCVPFSVFRAIFSQKKIKKIKTNHHPFSPFFPTFSIIFDYGF
jgi:hypothetical protein